MKAMTIKNDAVLFLMAAFFSFLPFSSFSHSHPVKKAGNDKIILVDPLIKVFKYSNDLQESALPLDVARGEYASIQIVCTPGHNISKLTANVIGIKRDAGGGSIANPKVKFVGYVKQGNYAEHPASDVIRSKDNTFPDPLFEDPYVSVKANENQAIWITVPIADNQPAGNYTGQVQINLTRDDGTVNNYTKKFSLIVYPVSVSKKTLWVSNWAAMLNPYHIPVEHPEKVKLYSKEYWAGISKLARMMSDYRQNVAKIETIKLVKYNPGAGNNPFNFDRMDTMINILLENGIKRIEGDFIAVKMGGWESPVGFYMPKYNTTGSISTLQKINNTDKNAQNFYEQYLPALYNHLKQKGWENIYFQHISDEPSLKNDQDYGKMRSFVKKVVPNLKCIEALAQPKPEDLDIQVPQLTFLEEGNKNFKDQQQKTHCELWFYICNYPQGNIPNRFLETPLIKTRLIQWINFKYDYPGFLQWAFNMWNGYPFDFSKDNSVGGDSWIVYPKNGTLLSSIRLEATRDGIVDYELLKQLQAKHPEQAKKIADSYVINLYSYNTDIKKFRDTRKLILESIVK